MDWFEIMVYCYMVFLVMAIVCDLWLLWSNHQYNKKLDMMDRAKELRFAKFRQVEHQFLK